MVDEERTDWSGWMHDLGRRIRRVREFLGLSQDQVARMAGVSQGAVSRLEAGRGLATPMLVVLKVNVVLARSLAQLDAGVIDDQLRDNLDLGGFVRLGAADKTGDGRITKDPEFEEIVELYHALAGRERRTLVAVVRATARSLVKTPSAAAS